MISYVLRAVNYIFNDSDIFYILYVKCCNFFVSEAVFIYTAYSVNIMLRTVTSLYVKLLLMNMTYSIYCKLGAVTSRYQKIYFFTIAYYIHDVLSPCFLSNYISRMRHIQIPFILFI